MLATLLSFLALIPPEVLVAPPTALEVALSRISGAQEYKLRLAIPGGGEHVMPFRQQADGEGTTWGGWRIAPSLISKAIPDDGKGKGQVTLTLEFPGKKEPTVLRSRGLAEDVYLMQTMVPKKDAAKWLEKAAPDSKMVVLWAEKEPDAGGKRIEKVPADLAAAVKLGQEAYEAKRPELIRRFNTSFLFYPPMPPKSWALSAGKDVLWLESACHDRMYAARFRVELRITDKGEWEVTRILAKEYFKGD